MQKNFRYQGKREEHKSKTEKHRSGDGVVLVVDGVHAEVTQGPETQHQNKENSRKLRERKTQS